MKAGVIAVQGDVSEHAAAIRRAADAHGVDQLEVAAIRHGGIVPDCDLLSVPGGESTTISRLLHDEGIAPEIRDHVDAGKPVLATCAGLIVLSEDAKDDRVRPLGLVDEVGDSVEALGTWDGRPVAVRDGSIVATAFHPELTDDVRIHRLALFARERAVVGE